MENGQFLESDRFHDNDFHVFLRLVLSPLKKYLVEICVNPAILIDIKQTFLTNTLDWFDNMPFSVISS